MDYRYKTVVGPSSGPPPSSSSSSSPYLPFDMEVENKTGPTAVNRIADKYINSLTGGEPLRPKSSSRVNSSLDILNSNVSPNHKTTNLSPNPQSSVIPSSNLKQLSPTRSSYSTINNGPSHPKPSLNSHFRTLTLGHSRDSSIDQMHLTGVSEDTEDVIGMSGRLRLQKNEETTSSFATKNWMDSQRKNIQTYEYLCHIGEAKQWIEACIKEEIPSVVELEEKLRDGVILAKITKCFAPHLVRRIFEAPRLQFRHSDNINVFFNFLDEIGMPDLFSFELTDLYDRKNIPKVIYCLHALSFILSAERKAPAMGDLVGKLEFTEDEIRDTQRGLDANGLSLPNFKGMNKHFGGSEPEALPESEPIKEPSAEHYDEEIILLQSVGRGSLLRENIYANRYLLDRLFGPIVALQSVIRGHLLRQSLKPRMVEIQLETNVRELQTRVRGVLIRRELAVQREELDQNQRAIISLQSAARGNVLRKNQFTGLSGFLSEGQESMSLRGVQALAKGDLLRKKVLLQKNNLSKFEPDIITLQSMARAKKFRFSYRHSIEDIMDNESWIRYFQSLSRGNIVRKGVETLRISIYQHEQRVTVFQSIARGHLTRKKFNAICDGLHSNTNSIVNLQSISRGRLVRRSLGSTLHSADLVTPSIIRLQSLIRGVLTRFEYSLMMEEFEDESESIIALQSICRGLIIRVQFKTRMQHFKDNMDKIIKIQSFVRAKKQGDAYRSLTCGTNPPLSTVKSFVHLLNDSELDFEQEVELEQSRKRVVDEVRSNEQLELFINQLDVKIALLLKNKISLDELVRHRNKGFKTTQSSGARSSTTSSATLGDMFDLKALNKASRRRLELYQGLFYILQTQPGYLARMFRHMKQNVISEKEFKDLEALVMAIYGYAQNQREEFFLLQLICRSIREEAASCDGLKSMRGNFIFWKLLAAMNRGTKQRKFLKDLLGPLVSIVVDRQDLDLESDPLAIYRTSINEEELRTGQLSSRNPNVPVDEAIRDPTTRATFIVNLQRLRELTTEFITAIDSSVDAGRFPYHIRLVAKEIYRSCKSNFLSENNERLMSLVGRVVFNNYLNPAILAADNYGVINNALSPSQTKNLSEVVKMLNQISSMKPFSRENVYLQPLNDYVKASIIKMKEIFLKIIDIPDIEQQYDMNVFDDLTSHRRPTLYIKTSETFAIHSLVCQELEIMCPDTNDALRDVVQELGALPNDATEILNIARFTEVKLELNPSFCKIEDPEAEINSLFVAAKRCLLYVLRVQSGADLLNILVSPVLTEHEEKYRAILREEQIDRRKRNVSEVGDLSSYRELKLLALEKVIELESYGRISRDDNYQEILNSIAVDIRTKRDRRLNRQKEMETVHQTLAHLNEKEAYLKTQLKTYNDYIEQAMLTLQTKKGKKKPILPFTKQYFHLRDLQKSGRVPKFGSYKYTAANLFDKGILVELSGYSERQFDKVTFTFSSDQVGVFNIEAAYGSIALPGATGTLTLDELLGQQFNNRQYIMLFDDMAKLNTNLTLHFIFRKFYGDSQ